MAKPTDEAWKAAMYMIAWMRSQRKRGIKFNSDGNLAPVIFCDAAFNPDPADGVSQYGYSLMWMGGPIATCSKKLGHVGLSAYHNEYMALRYAAAEVMWIRQLLEEMGCGCFVKSPTLMYAYYGDNDSEQANRLTVQYYRGY